MADIIDTIDNLARDERDLRCEPNSPRWFKADQLLCTELKKHWPAISARLRALEEYQRDSADRMRFMVGQRTELERKAKEADRG